MAPARRPLGTTVKASVIALAAAGFIAPGVVAAPFTDTAAAVSPAAVPPPLAGWQHDRLASGVDLYQGTIAGRPGADHWTVTVRANGAQLGAEQDAQALAERLRGVGFGARTERVDWPAGADRSGLIGVRIRVGEFAARADADAQRQALAAAGFDAVSEWTGADGTPGTGTARVKVALVDPKRYGGALKATYGTAVAGREKVSDMAAGEDALLGINAGFFVMEGKDGVPGASAGIAAYDGELQSAATGGRVAAVLRGDGLRPEFKKLSTVLRVRSGKASAVVDGVNRVPGLVRNCGGVGGDAPTQRPQHDVTCTDPDEIVEFTDELGTATPAGAGLEAVIDAKGRVRELRPRGGDVPEGGSVLAGIGDGASWLRTHAKPGGVLTVQRQIRDERGRAVELGPHDDIVNGGPELVRDGKVAVNYGADGIERVGDRSFAYAWGLKRNPRALLGVDRQGRMIVVAVDGRQPGSSDGFGLNEGAELMKSLGAVRAMALDGGGSVAMTVNGKVINSPSDGTERAVGDALLLSR
ncbi:phosphodiester glycosidase family protein [Streptomyces sp. NBC_01381]|uniref:phosphodiester glycosidase family protein n=1 Tax=Streptomyces sp. NBC_01381 TaxID=2903845 RepID=UPI0022547279|nr:phosphodiester glycosidase family protein [Streptomyces sp. NBC_01381]MCX4669168.1 phosphodiester glycosidase family protein [Streptomyces sp. NBC_01381]